MNEIVNEKLMREALAEATQQAEGLGLTPGEITSATMRIFSVKPLSAPLSPLESFIASVEIIKSLPDREGVFMLLVLTNLVSNGIAEQYEQGVEKMLREKGLMR